MRALLKYYWPDGISKERIQNLMFDHLVRVCVGVEP